MERESEADLAPDALMRRDNADGSGGSVIVMVAVGPKNLVHCPPSNVEQGWN
jgi:hypothetical protein